MNAIYKLMLDLNRSGMHEVVRVKLHDTMRELHMYLNEGSESYHISGGVRAVLSAKKPDGNVIFNTCDIAGDKVIYRFTGQETAAAGVTECELRLYDGDRVICSARFEILVDGTAVDDEEVMSLPEATELTRLMHHSEEVLERLDGIHPVSYEEQELTWQQAAQARANIMAAGQQEFEELQLAVEEVANDAVRISAQTLTEDEKTQARGNIGAVGTDAFEEYRDWVEDNVVKYGGEQDLTEDEKAQARANISTLSVVEIQDAIEDAINDSCVKLVEQEINEGSKAQARKNIEAWGEMDFYDAIPYVTPEQYGAVGDGATDDTAAVSSALNSGKVVVGSGTYLIKQTITSVGAMAVGCKFILDNTGGNEFTFIFTGDHIRLKNCSFTVVPYADASNKETRNGVCLRDCDNAIVDGCMFTAKNAKVNGYFDLYSNWQNVRVQNCTFDVDTEYEGEIHMGGIWARDFYKKGSSNLIFSGCTVNHHTKDECLAVWSTESNLNNVVVRDCSFYATGMPNCIKFGGINDLLVSNINVVTDAYAFLVTLVYHDSQGSNMKFVDSTFTSLENQQKTIYSRNNDRILFKGCTFTGPSFNADGNLDFEDCSITATENTSTNMGDVAFRGCDITITQTSNAFSKTVSKFRNCRITSTGNFMQFTSATSVVELDRCKINSGDNRFIIGSTDAAKIISRCDFLGANQYNLYNFKETDAVLFNVFDARPNVNSQTTLIGAGTNYVKSTRSPL